MIHATLCFLMRGNPPSEILLGLKKVGLGQGKYGGFGEKIEAGETKQNGYGQPSRSKRITKR
jgi:8-oxo-dGTP diphosphatase